MPLSDRDCTRTIGSGQLCKQFMALAMGKKKRRESGVRSMGMGMGGEGSYL